MEVRMLAVYITKGGGDHMSRRNIRIKAVRRQEPNVQLFVQALIELARQRLEREAAASSPASDSQPEIEASNG